MPNPALRARGQDVRIVFFDGTAQTVPGIVRNAETTAGEASATFADAGPLAWLDYDGDPRQIEFCEYTETGTGTRLHRRVTKRERVGTVWPSVKCNLSSAGTVMPAPRRDFDPRSFSPLDFG